MNKIFPKARVFYQRDHFGPGYHLIFTIKKQTVRGFIRKIEGTAEMDCGGSFGDFTFYVPFFILFFEIDGGYDFNDVYLKRFLPPLWLMSDRFKIVAFKPTLPYPKNKFRTYY